MRRDFFLVLCAAVSLWPGLSCAAQSRVDEAQRLLDRAIIDFENGRVAESVAGFDNVVKALPAFGPELWQRGIALYYVGRYDDCRAQFESHRTVNPDDVENAFWHYLCVARASTPAKARASLLPVGPDSRVPMRQVYEMLRGASTPDQVIAAAGSDIRGQFFAQLYVGLYYDAQGDNARARQYMAAAAADRFAAAGGYMHRVANVHLQRMR
jgi:lipoprotein NlpI